MELGSSALPAPPPEFVVRLLVAVRRFLLRLADRVLPSELAAFEHAVGFGETIMMREVARLGIADLLAAGPRTAAELSATLKVDADVLRRVLRGLVCRGVFSMDTEGRFANNHVSRGLLSGVGTSRNFVAYIGDRHNLLAWDRVDATLRDGRCGFGHAYDGADLWRWYEEHPAEHEGFAAMMADMTVGDASAVATAWPWGEVKVVCDVGGGIGAQLSEILVRHPELEGLLFDSERTVAASRELLLRRGVEARVRHVAGSFFEQVPGGADVYLLKNILHDWGDEPSLRILEQVRRAMKPGARVVVAEALVPELDATHPGVIADVHMMMLCEGGRERSEDEMRDLLRRAGLRVTRVVHTPVFMGLVEAVAMEP